MQVEVLYPGAYAMAKVTLENGESAKAESGAMVAMSSTVDIAGKAEGGLLKGLTRMVAGESFFFQTVNAARGAGEVLLAPAIPGDVTVLELSGGNEYMIQKGSFLAAGEQVEINTKAQGMAKGLFSGEGFFILKASGTGHLVLSSFGAIHTLNLGAGEEYVVDNGHLVAWTATTSYNIEKASKGWISSLTSGEGLVCRFKGPGKVLIQTRNPPSFGAWVRQFIPAKG